MEIDLLYEEGADVDEVVAGIKRILINRHGREISPSPPSNR